jgi:uncharacterized coiled-coil DUF342 family protein
VEEKAVSVPGNELKEQTGNVDAQNAFRISLLELNERTEQLVLTRTALWEAKRELLRTQAETRDTLETLNNQLAQVAQERDAAVTQVQQLLRDMEPQDGESDNPAGEDQPGEEQSSPS